MYKDSERIVQTLISILSLVLYSSNSLLFLICALFFCFFFINDRALVAKALMENPNLINWWLTFKAFYGLAALICGNGYIVGINQIYDIGIDKYDKLCLQLTKSVICMILFT